MKTPQFWNAEFRSDAMSRSMSWERIDDDQIRAIQQDAYRSGLLKAAQVCRDLSLDAHHQFVIKAIESESTKPLP